MSPQLVNATVFVGLGLVIGALLVFVIGGMASRDDLERRVSALEDALDTDPGDDYGLVDRFGPPTDAEIADALDLLVAPPIPRRVRGADTVRT